MECNELHQEFLLSIVIKPRCLTAKVFAASVMHSPLSDLDTKKCFVLSLFHITFFSLACILILVLL